MRSIDIRERPLRRRQSKDRNDRCWPIAHWNDRLRDAKAAIELHRLLPSTCLRTAPSLTYPVALDLDPQAPPLGPWLPGRLGVASFPALNIGFDKGARPIPQALTGADDGTGLTECHASPWGVAL